MWETATGREVGARWPKLKTTYHLTGISLANDGRTAAAIFGHWESFDKGTGSCTREASNVVLYEVATGRPRRRLPLIDGQVQCAFTHDGKDLVTSSSDGTAMVWEVYPRPAEQVKPLSADDARRLWDALADEDPEKAFAAVCRLKASPAEAVALIGARLKPVALDADRIRRPLTDLDSDRFATREAATKELSEQGEAGESILRQALKADLSPEARWRIEDLLRQIEERDAGPAGLQRLRALEVLEHAGTPQAKQLLERLAGGAKEARLSRRAKSVLERLARLPGGAP